MKQKQFEQLHATLWQTLEKAVQGTTAPPTDLPAQYRRLCQSLALCLQRGYSPALADYLQKLVTDVHRTLYGTPLDRPNTLRKWLLVDMPREVRREWRLLALAMTAFFGVGLLVGLLTWWQPYLIFSFIDAEQLATYHSMYQPGNTGRGGDAGDVMMFGHYIWNNISIGFRTFAGGVFGGIPALLSLGFNGLHFGVIGSALSQDPSTREPFWSFVITHASFEITGLLLAGQCGLRLGFSLLFPGRLSRRHALRSASQRMFPVLVGASLLTLLAAFFEGFWSAEPSIAPMVKFVVGGICWLLVIAFFCFAGREPR